MGLINKRNKMPRHKDDIEILKISLTELRRFYDHLSNIYDQLRVKTLGLMVGEVAIVSFIFANGTNLSVPEDADRQFFFWLAITLLSIAFALFVKIISTMDWTIPHNLENSKEIYNNKNYGSELKFVEYLHDDFIDSIQACRPKVEKKTKMFNQAVYILLAGVIILMVIKFGAPHKELEGENIMIKITAGTKITKGA